MPSITEIANAYVDESAALNPYNATMEGIPGYDDKATDFSPAGVRARGDLARRTLQQLDASPPSNDAERLTRDVMRERLQSQLDLEAAGEHLRELNVLHPPSGAIRQVFDQMGKDTDEEWQNVLARLALVPSALAGYRETLDEGLREGKSASRRHADAVAIQADTWAGRAPGAVSYFARMISDYDARPAKKDALAGALKEGATKAAQAYVEFADYLRNVYAPATHTNDPCGPERYQLNCRQFSGIEIDLRETYEWGWDELHRLEDAMRRTAERIKPGSSPAEAVQFLNTDESRSLPSVEAYRDWLQEVTDAAVHDLDGVHFDIEPRVQRIEVMIPPPGGALAPHYTTPSEDFTRPGRTWWPTGSATRFPKWDRVSIAYHEGVPGHHLQMGAQLTTEGLSRYQRLTFISGHGEGWALYAERLMDELGYLENPDYYMGLLSSQALRIVRIIIDIGLHAPFAIPQNEAFHPGETWNYDLAVAFATEKAQQTEEFMRSECLRYLGWPAQAISYKLGEREWLRVREAARTALGPAFDLKRFHTEALALGALGLSMLEPEVLRRVTAQSS